jgi:uncharacterized membrane protein
MDADATNRESHLEARIAALEARLARLEGRLGDPGGIEADEPDRTVDPPPPPPAWPAPAPATSYWVTKGSPEVARATVATGWVQPSASQAPASPPRSFGGSLRDLEARMTGRALAWVGGLALVLGAIFFLSLAFSRGWIGPEGRVVIGLVAGGGLLAGGAAFMERRNRLLGHVLAPVGLAVISISLVGATRLYGLIPVEVGLGIALVSAVAAAAIAIRANSPVVAAFGLISVLLAPPLFDAPPDSATLAFVGAVLVGTTAVALWRTWSWLPTVAFIVTVPQVASWIAGRPDAGIGLAGVSLFWTLNMLSAGGEEFRRRRNDLRLSSATLLVANAVFVIWIGFEILSGDLAGYRGLFLVLLAAAHLLVGWFFVVRDGERHLFGLLAIGTGVATLTMAAPVQLGAPAVPIAWTLEAVALTWLAIRRSHPYGALAAAILFVLAAGDVIWLHQAGDRAFSDIALLDGAAAALAFFAGGVVAGVLLLRSVSGRSLLAALGLVTVAWCVAERLDGLPAVAALTALTVITFVTIRLLPELPTGGVAWQTEGLIPKSMASLAEWRPMLELAVAGVALLVAGTTLVELSADPAAAEYAWAAVIGWAILGVAPRAVLGSDNEGRDAYRLAAFVGTIAASVAALAIVAPPTRLAVSAAGVEPAVAVETAAALGILTIGVALVARSVQSAADRRWVWIWAGFTVVYLVSVAAVDVVATQVGRGIDLDELKTQGQVALSVTWAVSGLVGFVTGLRLRAAALRQAGLILLGLATAKVFLFDLASLEIAYRVISLIALGFLLLASAWVWQRLQPGREAELPDPPA